MGNAYPVAVVGAKDIDAAVCRGIDLVGGIGRYVRSDAHVVIKVNMFTDATPESAKVTHPAVVLAVARLCHKAGARVSIVERRPHYDTAFGDTTAIEQVAQLVSLNDVPHTHKVLPGSCSLVNQVPWPDIIDACDVFINIPGLRTHALTTMSNGMKNLMGLLPDESTRLIHHYGLDGSICDLSFYRPSDLVVTEAIYTLEGNFPSEGSPVRTDLITVATNVVAADLVAARILGLDPEGVYHLQEAVARGMGPTSLDEVSLIGDSLKALIEGVHIEPAPTVPDQVRGPVRVFADDICASCERALAGGLLAANHRLAPEDLQGVTIIAGHQDGAQDVGDDKVVIYGNCAYRHRHLGRYEPGCPPLAGQVARGIDALRARTIKPSMCSIAWREEPIEAVVPIISAAGYLGVEAWGPHLDRYVETHGSVKSLASELRDLGLQVPMISAYMDLATDLAGSVEIARRYLGYAQILQAPLIRVFTRGGDSADASTEVWHTVVQGLRQLCDLDPEMGFALETHGGHLHDTTDSTLRLIRQTGMSNLCVNLDIYNLQAIGEDPQRSLSRLLPWVRILHLKNGSVRGGERRSGVPLAEGDMDYDAFLGALAESNWGGFASIEWFGDDPAVAAVREMAYLRQVLGVKLEGRQEAVAGRDRR